MLRLLAGAPEGRTKTELVDTIGETSTPTVQRCLVLQNPIARWLSHVVWCPDLDDEWIGVDLLQRRVPYASVREFARTLRAFAHGVVLIEPTELREAVFEPTRRMISA